MRLFKAWKEFQERLGARHLIKANQPAPNVNDIVQFIAEMSAKWETDRKSGKYGRIKQYFHKFCAELNSHSNLLELLPAGSEYVSLFTGTLNSIIRASVNHETIALGLSRSLSELTNIVAECKMVRHLYDTEGVQMLIANLYAHIFLFLKDAMEWYLDKQWKRILRSLRQDFYEDFKEQLSDIRVIANQIKHRSDMGLSAEQRVTRLTVEQINADLRAFTSDRAGETAELQDSVRKLEQRIANDERRKQTLLLESPEKMESLAAFIVSHMVELLEGRAIEWIEQRKILAVKPEDEMYSPINPVEASPTRLALQGSVGREEYLAASRDLELHFDSHQIRRHVELGAQVSVSREVSDRLRSFVSDGHEPVLAMAGSTSLDHHGLSTMAKVAASFVGHAIDIGLPTISWFCGLSRDVKENTGLTREATALISMTYALIRQLIEILPLRLGVPLGVSTDDLVNLGKTGMTSETLSMFETALSSLAQLISQIDVTTFIVIDGIQWLDDVSTSPYLNELIKVLVRAAADNHQARGQQRPVVRVLLTTTGRSRSLLRALENNVYLLADRASRQRERRTGSRLAW